MSDDASQVLGDLAEAYSGHARKSPGITSAAQELQASLKGFRLSRGSVSARSQPLSSCEQFFEAAEAAVRSGDWWILEPHGEDHYLQSDGKKVQYGVGGVRGWETVGAASTLLLGLLFVLRDPKWYAPAKWQVWRMKR